ncbi:hypothetical protein [Psychroserpens luteolus]|uniref:hypothetical protein n=1 Tax=Psychroserpens luteolus TaxID=2855840 RepID=UPI001E29E838|nr:hypothetical protein [Psychroserpens luteolus]MCD2260448.1 hypothetical protein [Psychroserpens luteolus]
MKNLLNLGKALNKAQQKAIFGGTPFTHVCDNVMGDQCCHYVQTHVTPCPTPGSVLDSGCWVKEKVCTGGVN